MIPKKKGLCLGLLLSLLGIGNGMQAYKLIIRNNTPFRVRLRVSYIGETRFLGILSCQPDVKWLEPKKSIKLSSGGCLVKRVTAVVHQRPIPGDIYFADLEKKTIEAERYYASAGRAGNTTFIINAIIKFIKNKSEIKYTVARK